MFALAIILGQVQADRSEEVFFDEGGGKVVFCEEEKIWEQIAVTSEVATIRGIPWKDIYDLMDDYVADQETSIQNLEQTITKLSTAIAAKQASTNSAVLNTAQIQDLINTAMEHDSSFKGLERARVSKCGIPRLVRANLNERIPIEAPENAGTVIRNAAVDMLQQGAFKTTVQEFTSACRTHLNVAAGEDAIENYCIELCGSLANMVQSVSDQDSNSKGSVATLQREWRKANEDKANFEKDRDRCKVSKTNVESFHTQLKLLDDAISLRYKEVQQAEWALSDAQWAVDKLKQELDLASEKAANALASLGVATQENQDAKTSLELADRKKDDFQKVLSESDARLSELREALDDAKRAEEAFVDVKKAVSMTMLRMSLFFEQTVRSKVRDIGVNQELAEEYPSLKKDVFALFKVDTRRLSSAERFQNNLHDFHTYCSETAMPLFDEMKHYVDLTELCNLGEETTTQNEVLSSVDTRIGTIVEDLADIKTWQDPYKGLNDMSREAEEELAAKGEPLGLRQIMTVYSGTSMYTSYLKKWKIEGPFLALLAKLKKHVDQLVKDVQTAQQEDSSLQEQFEDLGRQQLDAVAKLQAAIDRHASVNGEEETTRLAAEDLKNQHARAKESFQDLENKLDLAIQKYREACKALKEEHSTTSQMIENSVPGNSLLDASLL